MDHSSASPAPETTLAIPRWELIALTAMLMALNALAIDIMLPGLQEIGASLGAEDPNSRQYVISAYILGMGSALLVYGPLSDRFGRRIPLLAGLTIYVVAAICAAFAPNFETLLVLRLIQGAGAAATRVIAVSIVRDRFGGRAMAEIMSLVMMIFMIVPIIAPALGQAILLLANWHYIFIGMAVLGTFVAIWAALRLPETLRPQDRRPFTLSAIASAAKVVLTNKLSLFYTLASGIMFGGAFGSVNSAQQIYVGIYDLGVWFPLAFAFMASMMGVSSFLNSRLVMRFGMRRLSHAAVLGFVAASLTWFAWSLVGELPLPAFIILLGIVMFQFGCIMANFNSMAMEPLGHLAGSASAIQGFIQTIAGGLIGAIIGQAFDGTTMPLAAGFLSVGVAGLILVLIAENGRLFRAHQQPVTRRR